nr:hypothetical protein [uncultured Campylobacter sp.]
MQSCEIRISIGKRREQIRRAKFLNLKDKGKIAMADKLIDIGLILFFGGFCMLYKRRIGHRQRLYAAQ